MNNKKIDKTRIPGRPIKSLSKQSGMMILGIVALLLLVVGVLIVTASKSTVLETKMVSNFQDKQRSVNAAESAALYAWSQVQSDFDVIEIINNDQHPSYYVLGSKITSTYKSKHDWDGINQVPDWPWDDSAQRSAMPQQLGGDENPMKLQEKPQYIIGMHDEVMRVGTANYKCIPVSIIGASKGGGASTQTLIELKAIPKSACYREKIK